MLCLCPFLSFFLFSFFFDLGSELKNAFFIIIILCYYYGLFSIDFFRWLIFIGFWLGYVLPIIFFIQKGDEVVGELRSAFIIIVIMLLLRSIHWFYRWLIFIGSPLIRLFPFNYFIFYEKGDEVWCHLDEWVVGELRSTIIIMINFEK